MLVHHELTDAAIDAAIDKLHQRQTAVIPIDTGVSGVKATAGTFDGAPRVLLRSGPNLVAVVPPDAAANLARSMASARVDSPAANGEALHAVMKSPHGDLWMVPEEIRVATVAVTPRADGGFDAKGDGDCDDEEAAARAESQLRALLDRFDNFIVRAMTRNILGAIQIRRDGARLHLELAASRAQVEAVLGLIASFYGVDL
jgi:hypothetical protein